MFNNDPDKIYAVPESEGGATEKKNDARIPKRDDAPKTTTTGNGCGATVACLVGFLLITAAALVLRVM